MNTVAKKSRVDWTEHETRQFESYLKQEYDKDPQAISAVFVARAMARFPEERRRSVLTSKLHVQAGEFLRNGTLLPSRATESSPSATKAKAAAVKAKPPETVRIGEEARQPSEAIITHPPRPNGPAGAPSFTATPAASPAVAEAPALAPVQALIEPLVTAFFDMVEDKLVDMVVNAADRALRHPAIVRGLHGLVRSSFEKDAETAVDKTTATWTERGPTARLPRVLIAGVTPAEKEKAQAEYGTTLMLRFWEEESQSKGHLKQMLYGSADVVVLPARISHSAMQIIKSRLRKPPIYVEGYGAAAMQVLERLAKQAIVQTAAAGASP